MPNATLPRILVDRNAVSPVPIDGEIWMGLNVDVKGTIYEGLLERNAGEVKSGAGQYFTPRPLIDAIVYVIDPEPIETIHDPAVGTGGFLLSACDHMRKKPAANRKVATRRREDRLSGKDIVVEVVRLCANRVSKRMCCSSTMRPPVSASRPKRFGCMTCAPTSASRCASLGRLLRPPHLWCRRKTAAHESSCQQVPRRTLRAVSAAHVDSSIARELFMLGFFLDWLRRTNWGCACASANMRPG